jgi:nicotinamide riboside kinase
MIKVGLIGTSCSGKTTMAYGLVTELRKLGYHAEGVLGSDRKYTFNSSELDINNYAQAYVILQQAFLETQCHTRDDVNVVITDRTPFDFFSYYEYCFYGSDIKNETVYNAMKNFAYEWIKTYDLIFYLSPLPYVSDNKRPNDAFRQAVDLILQKNIDTLVDVPVVKIQDTEHNVRFDTVLRTIQKKINE